MKDLRPDRWHMRYNSKGKIVPGGADNFGPLNCCTTSTTTTCIPPEGIISSFLASITDIATETITYYTNPNPEDVCNVFDLETNTPDDWIYNAEDFILATVDGLWYRNNTCELVNGYYIDEGPLHFVDGVIVEFECPTTTTTTTAIPGVQQYGLLYNWWNVEGTGDSSITSSDDWIVPSLADG